MRGDDGRSSREEVAAASAAAAASPFASLALSGSGENTSAATAAANSSPQPSALKLSVSGRLSRSFSKLGLTRMSSNSGGGVAAGLSRRTLLDEGKSRYEEGIEVEEGEREREQAAIEEEGGQTAFSYTRAVARAGVFAPSFGFGQERTVYEFLESTRKAVKMAL